MRSARTRCTDRAARLKTLALDTATADDLAAAWAQLARTGALPDAPGWRMAMRWSREFTEALEGEKILCVLRGMVRLQEPAVAVAG